MKMRTRKIIAPVIFGATALIIAASASLQLIAHRIRITPAGALGAVQNAGAFSAVGGELDIEESQSTGIKLMSARIAPEDYAENGIDPQAASAYTLTATVYPEDASYKALDWSLAWNQTATDENGNIMYTADSWYCYEYVDENGDDTSSDLCTYELAGYGITEYDFLTITPNVDGGNVLTITCKKEFACPINITCTARDGSGVSATCKVDLAVKAYKAFISAQSNITLTEYSRNDTEVRYYVNTTQGTVKPTTTRTAIAWLQTKIEMSVLIEDNVLSTDYRQQLVGAKTYFFGEQDVFYDKELTSNIIFTYNTTWDTFCDTYVVVQDPSLTEAQKRANRDVARKMLLELKEKGILSQTPFFYLGVTVTDSYTGQTFSEVKNIYLNDVSKIPVYTTNVSNIELPESIVL